MQIILNYDSSVASAPSGFQQTLTAAADVLDALITNNITVNIQIGWGEVNGGSLGSGEIGETVFTSTLEKTVDFTTLDTDLNNISNQSIDQQYAVLSIMADGDPSSGVGNHFVLFPAQEKALGISVSGTVDAYVGFSSTASWNFGTVHAAVPGQYDFLGTAEHELTHALGRWSMQQFAPGSNGFFSVLDLERFSSPGTVQLGAGTSPYFSIDGGFTTLGFYDTASDWSDWKNGTPPDAFDSFVSTGTAETLSAVDIQQLNVLGFSVLCFCHGTGIRTPHGDVPVERLAIGDEVVTWSGAVRRIRWIGVGRVRPKPRERGPATPVIVRKSALADNVPNRDLRVTKGHSLLLDGLLVPVEELVNHRSILWDDTARDVSIYHVELDTHDVLIANGAPAESYRDDGNRWLFQNMNSGWDRRREATCAPLLHDGPEVNALWRRLLDRAGARPGLPLTDDPDLHLLADGERIEPFDRRADTYVFRLRARPRVARLMSRSSIPQELGTVRDSRVLGVAVRRLVMARGRCSVVMEADDRRLTDGYHAFEARDRIRWTRGDAAVPDELFGGVHGAARLEVCLGGAVPYVEG